MGSLCRAGPTFPGLSPPSSPRCSYCYLQRPSDADVTDFILDQFDLLHRTYLADRPLIPPGALRQAWLLQARLLLG